MSAPLPPEGILGGLLGRATCGPDGQPTMGLNVEADHEGETRTHEQVHLDQLAELMNAKDWDCLAAHDSLTANPEANLQAEIPAYRAQLAHAQRHGARPVNEHDFYGRVATALSKQYSGEITADDILARLLAGK